MLLGAIIGATGVGKTSLAIRVAAELGAEIISVDSRQIYQGFRVGTAQPTAEERALVRHHLVDFCSPEEHYSAAQFVRDVHALLAEHPEKDFLLVGGTGLYLNALTDGLSDLPASDPVLRLRLEHILERRGLPFLYRWLCAKDPAAREIMDGQNSHRIQRALEISIQTKLPWSVALQRKSVEPMRFPILWVDRDREELYRRIDARVVQMFVDGWLQEIAALCIQVSKDCPAMQGLGYQEIASHLRGELSLADCLTQIQQKTRNYAKRQLTWFRNKVTCDRYICTESGKIDEISALKNIFKKVAQKP